MAAVKIKERITVDSAGIPVRTERPLRITFDAVVDGLQSLAVELDALKALHNAALAQLDLDAEVTDTDYEANHQDTSVSVTTLAAIVDN